MLGCVGILTALLARRSYKKILVKNLVGLKQKFDDSNDVNVPVHTYMLHTVWRKIRSGLEFLEVSGLTEQARQFSEADLRDPQMTSAGFTIDWSKTDTLDFVSAVRKLHSTISGG